MIPSTSQAEKTVVEPLVVDLGSVSNARDLNLIADRPHARVLKQAVNRAQLLRLAMRGITAKTAAKILGVGESVALFHYRDPEFQKEVMRRVSGALQTGDGLFVEKAKTLHERLQEQAERSFEDLIKMLEDDRLQPHLRVKINQDFLDRCSDSQKEATLNHKTVPLDPNQLALAAQTAVEMDLRREGKVVEIGTKAS